MWDRQLVWPEVEHLSEDYLPCPAASSDKCVVAEDTVYLAVLTAKCAPSYRNKMIIISGTYTTQALAEALHTGKGIQ